MKAAGPAGKPLAKGARVSLGVATFSSAPPLKCRPKMSSSRPINQRGPTELEGEPARPSGTHPAPRLGRLVGRTWAWARASAARGAWRVHLIALIRYKRAAAPAPDETKPVLFPRWQRRATRRRRPGRKFPKWRRQFAASKRKGRANQLACGKRSRKVFRARAQANELLGAGGSCKTAPPASSSDKLARRRPGVEIRFRCNAVRLSGCWADSPACLVGRRRRPPPPPRQLKSRAPRYSIPIDLQPVIN